MLKFPSPAKCTVLSSAHRSAFTCLVVFFLRGTCLVVVIALIGLVNHGQLAAFFHVVLYLKCGVADYTCSFVELNQAKVLVC